MSPEPAAGEPLDGRSDLYALGVLGFLALSGALPFDGPVQGVLVAHVIKPAPSLRSVAPSVPVSVAEVIDRGLSKLPGDHYQTADALATALDTALRDAEAAERSAADAAPGDVLSEQGALAIWQRAAQLQAEAAHRMERTAKLGAPAVDGDSAASADVESNSYRIRDVEAAAVEAGISRQYVALPERRTQRAGRVVPAVVSDRQDQQFTTMLGTTDRAISVSRVLPRRPRSRWPRSVTCSRKRRITYPSTIRSMVTHSTVGFCVSPSRVWGRWWAACPSRSCHATSSSTVWSRSSCSICTSRCTRGARGKPRPAKSSSPATCAAGCAAISKADWRFIGAGGALATAGGTAAFAGLLGSVGLAALPGVELGAVAAGATMLWYRWLYRQALEKALAELGEMLAAIDRHVTREQVFSFGDLLAPRVGRAQ